jgi:hypothetical protein
VLADFVADDAADGCTTNGTDCAAARQDGTADSSNTGPDSGVLVLRRHP